MVPFSFIQKFNATSASSLVVMAAMAGNLWLVPLAYAYKVEKICEDVPATSSVPAHKKCKVVRVKEGGAAKTADGKAADGKAPAGDAKKDAKPAAGH